jgi:hypothetical protein
MPDSGTWALARFQDDRATRAWRTVWPLLVGLALLFALALVLAMPRRQAAELGRLPDGARATLYQHAQAEVSSICGLPAALTAGVVRDHCIAQARFLTTFPECDHACQVGARAVLPHAHR